MRELLESTRPVDLSLELVEPKELLERVRRRGVVPEQAGSGGTESCRIEVDVGTEPVFADPLLLEQALLNLLTNSFEASGAPIELRAEPEGQGVFRFSVLDRGTGIAEKDLSQVSEPFFTSKSSGTGLGLTVVQRVAELHEGTIELRRRPGGGTEAILRISSNLQRTSREQDPSRR